MATHSSILPWEISWTEEPGRLQSIVSHRVRHPLKRLSKQQVNHSGFPGGSVGKETTFKAGDLGLIPGWGRSPEKETATHSNILAWEIPWTEEPGEL